MRTSTPPRSALSRVLTTFVTLALVVGQMMQPVHAVVTLLADQPIAAKVAAKPNIFYTLDDSGSMQLNYIPEYVVSSPATLAVASITLIGTTATATVASTANLAVGDWVTIAGANQPEYNGAFQIVTIVSPTQFTYTIVGTPTTPATGAKTYTTGSRYCRGGTNTAACGQILQNSNAWNFPPFFAADFNRMMYNPLVTYSPPLKWDGLPFTTAVPFSAANIDTNGNQGNGAVQYTKVQRDPFNQMSASTTIDNLSTKVTVPLYCNTDWPKTAGANLALNPDVGDANGEYLAGSGGWCRINGTNYDASAASTAPATAVAGVEMGYNYPWQSSTGAVGAQYFYKLVANKTLWCDKTSPYYPRNTGVITGCNGGVPVTGPAVKQSCIANGNTCYPVGNINRQWNPASCAPPADPALFCTPGIDGSSASTPGGGTGSLPECSACNCVQNKPPASPGHCSILTGNNCPGPVFGVLGSDTTNCPDQPSAVITSCTGGTPKYQQSTAPACTGSPNGVLFDPQTNTFYAPATTLLADANGPGIVCRHNVQAYAQFGLPDPGLLPAGLQAYPRFLKVGAVPTRADVYPANYSGNVYNGYPAYAQNGDFTTAVTANCPTVGTTVTIPRHYYTVDSVQFCDGADNTPDGQFRGFGTGVCQPKNDLTKFKYVKYAPFHRWDLIPTGTFPSGKVWLVGAALAATNNAGNSESINYANWYANYATRLNAAKTTSANGFANLTTANAGGDYRVGFHNLGEQRGNFGGGSALKWVDVADWTLAQRTAWYNMLFSIKVATFKTPTIDAMIRIGTFVEFGPAQTGLDANITPIPAAAKDPFPLDVKTAKPISCTNNYHILFTDGTTNQVYLPTGTGDQDGTPHPVIPPTGVPEDPLGTPQLVVPNLKVAGAWPKPFIQGTPAVGNTLADIAAHYWARDLRHDPLPGANLYKDNVPSTLGTGMCDVDGTNTVPCDLDWTKDVAWWQHVNFSAISFGTEGVLDAANRPVTMQGLLSGALSWPDLTNPNLPTHPLGAGAGAVAVDDLWHATVMGRGSFVNAKSPIEVSYGLANILSGIQNQRKSRSAAAFTGQVLNAANNVIFEPTIEAGWAGDLVKVEIDPATGNPLTVWWNFATVLGTQIKPATAIDEPWMDETKRRVVTLGNSPGLGGKTAGPGIPFQYASLSVAPQGANMLNSLANINPTQQQKIIAYLRGGTTFNAGAVTIEGTGIGQFRKRFSRVGDISNAQPLIIGPPGNGYDDDGTPGAKNPGYNAFVAAKAGRNSFLVAPANDGLVHVIDAGPMPPAVAAGGGNELFAYAPRALFRGIAGNIATEDTTAIQSLTYQDGGIPIFHHHMLVDSSPRVADVDFNNGIGAPDWHTIVVGGLGKGGNSYYALDVTDPFVATEAAAAAKVMWEWTDPDILYTFGRPVIVKVRDSLFPAGRWVVLVTASYNNVSGLGKVFVLDAKTGAKLNVFTTTAGSAANPSGLAQIHAFVKNQTDQVAEQIYGGDLLGNLWRIDVSAVDAYKNVALAPVLFAKLIDPLGADQPVTTAPQIEIDLNNGIDRYVFIGTGRLLDEDDFTNPFPEQQQTMYAIRDGTLSTIKTVGLPVKARPGQGGIMKSINGLGIAAIVGGAPNGWYHDLPNTAVDSQRIVVDVQANVNIAFYIGTQIPVDPCLIQLPAIIYARDYTTGRSLLEDSGGTIVASTLVPTGAVGGMLVGRIQPDGSQSLGVMVSGEVPGTTPYNIQNPVTGPGARMSWKLLTGE